MELANSMRGITENIISSYDTRVRALGDLVFDTHKTLREFTSDRKKMAKEQAESLREFTSDRKKMAKEQAESLANFVADLTKNVGNMMKGVQKTHKEMAYNLKESLEKGETDRLKNFRVMMGDIKKGIKEIETYVANKLKEFSDAHADLAKYVAGIVSETRKLLGEYRSDMKKAANAWQGMCKTMARARKGMVAAPKVETEVKVRPVEEAIAEANPRKKARRKRGR